MTSIAADAFEGCREDLVIASSADAYARTWAKDKFAWEHDPHTETIDAAVPATHVTTGLTQGSHCEACGEVITAQEVIPTVEVSTVRLPGMLKVIDQQAFSGNNFECVVLPEGCLRIEALAFENCANLRFIEIPASVTRIDPSAFTGCSEEMIIVTVSGSTAATFAAEHGFTCIIP